MGIWDEGLSLSWGIVMTWLAGLTSVVLLGYGWLAGDFLAALGGIAMAIVSATLTVIRDNAKTRRCVRAVVREQQQQELRSI